MASVKKVASWYRGHTADIQIAVDAGVLELFSAIFDIDKNTLSIYDTDRQLKPIAGTGTTALRFLDELPPVEQGETDALYVVGDTIYVFDGIKYQPQYVNYTPDIQTLEEDIDAVEANVATNTADIQRLSESLELIFV